VFVIMTVNAQVFPVGTVGRIVQVISVFVVDRQEMPRLFIELPSALGTDEPVDFKRALSIITPGRFAFL